jgi:peptidoglycan/xylan/chitin deacetylase (PgdA/CDA1 family)
MLRIYQTPAWLKAFFPKYLWRRNKNEKALYLTFDDGPIPEVTEWVLDTLQAYQAKATFFCIGDNIRKHPSVFRQIIVQGHQIGNHTFNHLKGWRTPFDKYIENTQECAEIIEINAPKHKSNLFRPPYGRITNQQAKHLLSQYEIVMWDVLTNDYDDKLKPEICLRKSIRATRNGSIIVFHDSLKAEKNLRFVLPRYLASCIELGYTFEKL